MEKKIVWITGASDGIGEALVKEYASASYKVVLSARRVEKMQAVAQSAGLASEDYFILPLDLSTNFDATQLTQQIYDRFGHLDALILNAGVSQKGLAISTLDQVERDIMEINYFSNVKLAKAAVAKMQEHGGGKIAVVSSIVGKFGSPFLSTYAASKHGIMGFFESLRYEVRPQGIHVLIVTPGFIKTGIAVKAVTEDGSAFNEDSKAQQNGTPPEKVAKQIKKALDKGKKHIYVGGLETWTPHFKFVFPNIFYKIWKKLHKL